MLEQEFDWFFSPRLTWILNSQMLRFMVKQAAEQLKSVLRKSAATYSRAGISMHVDNSVIEPVGK